MGCLRSPLFVITRQVNALGSSKGCGIGDGIQILALQECTPGIRDNRECQYTHPKKPDAQNQHAALIARSHSHLCHAAESR